MLAFKDALKYSLCPERLNKAFTAAGVVNNNSQALDSAAGTGPFGAFIYFTKCFLLIEAEKEKKKLQKSS